MAQGGYFWSSKNDHQYSNQCCGKEFSIAAFTFARFQLMKQQSIKDTHDFKFYEIVTRQ